MVVVGSIKLHRTDVLLAKERLNGRVLNTPIINTEYGLLKLENLQHTGAYKIRGATNALLVRAEEGPIQSAVTASAGNHAAGMAHAAKYLGVEAIAVVPNGTPKVKIENCRRLGCRVIEAGVHLNEAMAIAKGIAKETRGYFLHPFDDPQVICGQGTVGVELFPQQPDVVLVPIGGGGLASGVALAFAGMKTKVIGVQIEGADAMNRVLRKSSPLKFINSGIADGVAVSSVGQLTRQICKYHLSDSIVIAGIPFSLAQDLRVPSTSNFFTIICGFWR